MSNVAPSENTPTYPSSAHNMSSNHAPNQASAAGSYDTNALLSPRSDKLGVSGMAGVLGGGPRLPPQSASRWRTRGAQTLITGYDPTRLRSAIPELSADTESSASEGGRARGEVSAMGGAEATGGQGAWANAGNPGSSKGKLDASEDSGISEGLDSDRHRSSDMLVTMSISIIS